MSPALRLPLSLLVGLFGLSATLVAALPGVAAGLLLLLDYSLGGSLDVVRALVAALPWPQPGVGLLARPSVMMHPMLAAGWSLASAATGLAGTAMALAEWRVGRPGWRAALPCWAASGACGGVPVLVLLAPAAAIQLAGMAAGRHAARCTGRRDNVGHPGPPHADPRPTPGVGPPRRRAAPAPGGGAAGPAPQQPKPWTPRLPFAALRLAGGRLPAAGGLASAGCRPTLG